jgi:hypothetical protein
MDAAAVGVAEKEEEEQGMDQQDIFYRMVLCLATLTLRLFSRVWGADAAPCRPIMGTRGDTDGAAAETPSRWASAVRERAGASPRARHAASSAGKRTWTH